MPSGPPKVGVALISPSLYASLLISELQGRVISDCDSEDSEGLGMPVLDEKVLERLVEICAEDGMAVLEMADTGETFVVQKQEDDNDFILWQVKR